MTAPGLRADELLRIDYAAERRKLASGMLEAAWRGPAELVRRALRSGATRVAIEAGPAGVSVRDDGSALAEEVVAALRTLADPEAPEGARHQALVRLEPEPGLLAAGASCSFERRSGETRLLLRGCRLDAAARGSLAQALRFCPRPVSLDGERLPRGFVGATAEARIERPLPGGIALCGESGAEIDLVLDGVVVAHVSRPEAPGFSAWVDATPLVGPGVAPSAARLRASLVPHEPALVLAAVDLALSALAALDPEPGPERERAVDVLLAAARQGLRRSEVLRAPTLAALEDARPVVRSLLDLGREADAAPGRVLSALDPAVDPAAMLLPEGPVYRIGPELRARIAALLDVRFRPALPRESRKGPGARVRRALADLRRGLRFTAAWLCHPGAGRRLTAGELRPEEHALVRQLGPDVALTAGRGPVRRVAGEWRLPRQNALVAAAARAVLEDPRWTYPAAMALFEDRRPMPAGAAEAWDSGS